MHGRRVVSLKQRHERGKNGPIHLQMKRARSDPSSQNISIHSMFLSSLASWRKACCVGESPVLEAVLRPWEDLTALLYSSDTEASFKRGRSIGPPSDRLLLSGFAASSQGGTDMIVDRDAGSSKLSHFGLEIGRIDAIRSKTIQRSCSTIRKILPLLLWWL